MKREIKFRAWDKNSNEWFVPMFIRRQWYKDLYQYAEGVVLDCPIVQFTGLKDKNGREIYEGDVVRCFDTAGEKVYDRVVDFYGFRGEIWGEEQNGRTKVEIIGDIYENPELIDNHA